MKTVYSSEYLSIPGVENVLKPPKLVQKKARRDVMLHLALNNRITLISQISLTIFVLYTWYKTLYTSSSSYDSTDKYSLSVLSSFSEFLASAPSIIKPGQYHTIPFIEAPIWLLQSFSYIFVCSLSFLIAQGVHILVYFISLPGPIALWVSLAIISTICLIVLVVARFYLFHAIGSKQSRQKSFHLRKSVNRLARKLRDGLQSGTSSQRLSKGGLGSGHGVDGQLSLSPVSSFNLAYTEITPSASSASSTTSLSPSSSSTASLSSSSSMDASSRRINSNSMDINIAGPAVSPPSGSHRPFSLLGVLTSLTAQSPDRTGVYTWLASAPNHLQHFYTNQLIGQKILQPKTTISPVDVDAPSRDSLVTTQLDAKTDSPKGLLLSPLRRSNSSATHQKRRTKERRRTSRTRGEQGSGATTLNLLPRVNLLSELEHNAKLQPLLERLTCAEVDNIIAMHEKTVQPSTLLLPSSPPSSPSSTRTSQRSNGKRQSLNSISTPLKTLHHLYHLRALLYQYKLDFYVDCHISHHDTTCPVYAYTQYFNGSIYSSDKDRERKRLYQKINSSLRHAFNDGSVKLAYAWYSSSSSTSQSFHGGNGGLRLPRTPIGHDQQHHTSPKHSSGLSSSSLTGATMPARIPLPSSVLPNSVYKSFIDTLLPSLPADLVDVVRKKMHLVAVPHGTRLFFERQRADHLFLVCEGEAWGYREGLCIRHYRKGDVIGLESLLHPSSANEPASLYLQSIHMGPLKDNQDVHVTAQNHPQTTPLSTRSMSSSPTGAAHMTTGKQQQQQQQQHNMSKSPSSKIRFPSPLPDVSLYTHSLLIYVSQSDWREVAQDPRFAFAVCSGALSRVACSTQTILGQLIPKHNTLPHLASLQMFQPADPSLHTIAEWVYKNESPLEVPAPKPVSVPESPTIPEGFPSIILPSSHSHGTNMMSPISAQTPLRLLSTANTVRSPLAVAQISDISSSSFQLIRLKPGSLLDTSRHTLHAMHPNAIYGDQGVDTSPGGAPHHSAWRIDPLLRSSVCQQAFLVLKGNPFVHVHTYYNKLGHINGDPLNVYPSSTADLTNKHHDGNIPMDTVQGNDPTTPNPTAHQQQQQQHGDSNDFDYPQPLEAAFHVPLSSSPAITVAVENTQVGQGHVINATPLLCSRPPLVVGISNHATPTISSSMQNDDHDVILLVVSRHSLDQFLTKLPIPLAGSGSGSQPSTRPGSGSSGASSIQTTLTTTPTPTHILFSSLITTILQSLTRSLQIFVKLGLRSSFKVSDLPVVRPETPLPEIVFVTNGSVRVSYHQVEDNNTEVETTITGLSTRYYDDEHVVCNCHDQGKHVYVNDMHAILQNKSKLQLLNAEHQKRYLKSQGIASPRHEMSSSQHSFSYAVSTQVNNALDLAADQQKRDYEYEQMQKQQQQRGGPGARVGNNHIDDDQDISDASDFRMSRGVLSQVDPSTDTDTISELPQQLVTAEECSVYRTSQSVFKVRTAAAIRRQETLLHAATITTGGVVGAHHVISTAISLSSSYPSPRILPQNLKQELNKYFITTRNHRHVIKSPKEERDRQLFIEKQLPPSLSSLLPTHNTSMSVATTRDSELLTISLNALLLLQSEGDDSLYRLSHLLLDASHMNGSQTDLVTNSTPQQEHASIIALVDGTDRTLANYQLVQMFDATGSLPQQDASAPPSSHPGNTIKSSINDSLAQTRVPPTTTALNGNGQLPVSPSDDPDANIHRYVYRETHGVETNPSIPRLTLTSDHHLQLGRTPDISQASKHRRRPSSAYNDLSCLQCPSSTSTTPDMGHPSSLASTPVPAEQLSPEVENLLHQLAPYSPFETISRQIIKSIRQHANAKYLTLEHIYVLLGHNSFIHRYSYDNIITPSLQSHPILSGSPSNMSSSTFDYEDDSLPLLTPIPSDLTPPASLSFQLNSTSSLSLSSTTTNAGHSPVHAEDAPKHDTSVNESSTTTAEIASPQADIALLINSYSSARETQLYRLGLCFSVLECFYDVLLLNISNSTVQHEFHEYTSHYSKLFTPQSHDATQDEDDDNESRPTIYVKESSSSAHHDGDSHLNNSGSPLTTQNSIQQRRQQQQQQQYAIMQMVYNFWLTRNADRIVVIQQDLQCQNLFCCPFHDPHHLSHAPKLFPTPAASQSNPKHSTSSTESSSPSESSRDTETPSHSLPRVTATPPLDKLEKIDPYTNYIPADRIALAEAALKQQQMNAQGSTGGDQKLPSDWGCINPLSPLAKLSDYNMQTVSPYCGYIPPAPTPAVSLFEHQLLWTSPSQNIYSPRYLGRDVPTTLFLYHAPCIEQPLYTRQYLASGGRRFDGVLHGRLTCRLNVQVPSTTTENNMSIRVYNCYEGDIARLARTLLNISTGLVLGGGGARGLAHLGAIQNLYDHGIVVDCIAGTSQGAIMGGMFASIHPSSYVRQALYPFYQTTRGGSGSGSRDDPTKIPLTTPSASNPSIHMSTMRQRSLLDINTTAASVSPPLSGQINDYYSLQTMYDRVQRFCTTMASPATLLADATIPIISYFSGAVMNSTIIDSLGPYGDVINIDDLWLPYICISTNVSRADLNIHRESLLWHCIRASANVVGLLPPVVERPEYPRNTGDLWIDGGYLNNLPVDVIKQHQRPRYVIAVDVENKDEKHLQNISTVYGAMVSGGRLLLNKLLRAFVPLSNHREYYFPTFGDMINSLLFISHGRTIQSTGRFIDCYIRPPVQTFKLLDYDKYDVLIKLGYQKAESELNHFIDNVIVYEYERQRLLLKFKRQVSS